MWKCWFVCQSLSAEIKENNEIVWCFVIVITVYGFNQHIDGATVNFFYHASTKLDMCYLVPIPVKSTTAYNTPSYP